MWRFNGSNYDLSDFAKSHPGGEYLIHETRGYDITYLMQTNHNWTREKALQMVEKYKVDSEFTGQTIQWDTELDEIHNELDFNIKDMKTPWWGWLYFLFIGTAYVYSVGSWALYPTYLNGSLMGSFGFLFCGFIQHEASHNALSKNPIINYCGRFFLLPWADPYEWFIHHCVLHHQYTNTELDCDFQTEPNAPVRHHKDVIFNWMHKFQILAIQIFNPFVTFFYSPNMRITTIQFALILAHYLAHRNIWLAFTPFLIFGSWFMFITQLSHIQESAITEKLLKSPPNFARHQANSCVDYNHGNIVLSCLSIFLNYQTYHHLFPRISHFHYLHLKPKLEAILEKRGIIVKNDDIVNVIYNYFGYLHKLSK